MLSAPRIVGVNATSRYTVRLLPTDIANEDGPFTRHRLFCKVAPAPNGTGPSQSVLASFMKYTLEGGRKTA